MSESKQGKQSEREAARPVTFSCRAPGAKTIFVAGTFNDWRDDAVPLKRQADGLCQTALRLSPGHHEYTSSWSMANGAASRAATANITAARNAARMISAP
jgi:1,4-alpha-glucan branching enzyme